MRLILLLLMVCSGQGAPLVPFFSDPAYERDEPVDPPWFVWNNGEPSRLYHNGVYQSQEVGFDDLDLKTAWGIHSGGARVGIVDQTTHGDRVFALVNAVSPNSERVRIELLRWYASDLANGILSAVGSGCRVIVITGGFPTPDDGLSNACLFAESAGVLLVCAVPNVDGNLDAGLVDYPYEWSRMLCNILGATSTDRGGLHYSPSAIGSNAVAAPGRNIVAAGTYSSGTSYAAPILAGCAALLIDQFPGQPVEAYRSVLLSTARQIARRVDIVAALQRPVPVISISRDWVLVSGLPGWRYEVEWSLDLVNWSPLGGGPVQARPGYFRARVE